MAFKLIIRNIHVPKKYVQILNFITFSNYKNHSINHFINYSELHSELTEPVKFIPLIRHQTNWIHEMRMEGCDTIQVYS